MGANDYRFLNSSGRCGSSVAQFCDSVSDLLTKIPFVDLGSYPLPTGWGFGLVFGPNVEFAASASVHLTAFLEDDRVEPGAVFGVVAMIPAYLVRRRTLHVAALTNTTMRHVMIVEVRGRSKRKRAEGFFKCLHDSGAFMYTGHSAVDLTETRLHWITLSTVI